MRQSSMNPESFVTVERALRRVKMVQDGGRGWKDESGDEGEDGGKSGSGYEAVGRSVRWKGMDIGRTQYVEELEGTQEGQCQSRIGWMRARSQKLGRRRVSRVEK